MDSANVLLKSIQAKNYGFTKTNESVASATPFSSDTYLVGSAIAIPSGAPYVGTRYHCMFDVTKTAASTAAPTINIRFGTAGTTGDTSRCLFTFNIQTAVVDAGTFEVTANFRTVGSGTSAIIQGWARLHRNLAATGLGSVNPAGTQLVLTTGGGFDSTVASSIIGLSVNGSTSAAWTIQQVYSELIIQG